MGKYSWKLDGTHEEGLEALNELLKDVVLVITEDQERRLLEYLPDSQQDIDDRNINELIDQLEAKIEKVGKNADGSLNETGRLMRNLAVELDEQN